MELLASLNQSSQIVFVLGFGMSFGCHIDFNVSKSLPLIPLYRLFKESLDSIQPVVKTAVESFQTGDGILI